MNEFTVSFFWEGEIKTKKCISAYPPKGEHEALSLAWSAVRMWFEDNHKKMPSHVKNVTFDNNQLNFGWDYLPTTDSTPKQ